MQTMTYPEQETEWAAIRDELIDARGQQVVTAFDVTSEQERRMNDRGQRPLTMEEIYAQHQAGIF